MSRQRLDNRLNRLEARQVGGVDREEIARWRAKQERIRERGKEEPEGLKALLDAEDQVLIAIEEARVRGEDPEVREAHRAVQRAEQRLLGEDAAGPI